MIFLDANFIIALSLKKHEDNKKAVKIYKKIQNEELIISNLIIIEVINVLNIKLKQNNDLLKKVFKSMANLIVVDDKDYYYDGFLQVLNHKKRISLNNGIYIALMKSLKIKKIATFDDHFLEINGIERINNN